MSGNTKNLGQVSGVLIATTPPENTTLIWFDSTPSQRCHKIYDPALNQWVILNQGIISAITYSELTSIAQGVGLSVGKFFKITDKGNALALAITSTKVQYDDSLGNILIDDLGTNIQYHVTSSNLLIDDVAGVFDTTNKKLVFQFNEITTPDFSNDYILGKAKRNNVWSLVKYKFSTLLSTVTGNSLSWNNGLFFNFNSAFNAKLDQSGGAVAKDTYDQDIELLQQDIQNVASENQQIMDNANAAIAAATTDAQIYAKRMQAPQTTGEAIDLAAGDSLQNGLGKIQRFINKFKFATGIRVSLDFNDNVPNSYVNNNDTVDSALRKLQKQVKVAVQSASLSQNWEPLPYTETVPDVAGGDSLDEAFAKAIGRMNQIGVITNGKITSNGKAAAPAPEEQWPYKTVFNLEGRSLLFNADYVTGTTINGDETLTLSIANGVTLGDWGGRGSSLSAKRGLDVDSYAYRRERINNVEYGDKYVTSSAKVKGIATQVGNYDIGMAAGLTAYATGSLGTADVFDAYFPRLKASELFVGQAYLVDSDWDSNDEYYIDDSTKCTFFDLSNGTGNPVTIYLPAAPKRGQILLFRRASGKFVIDANGALFDGLIGKKYLDNDHDFVIGDILMLIFKPWETSGGAFTGHWLPCKLNKFSTM